ncbi:MANSC domain-containing protein 1 [Sceloporus undulatus]|uniref:MANSC domain-containing protein 1 n=1 Tax=Sceloporus undulatus TaxID=8520 RepID=UPI001C4D1F07|nr:MANSC domain-containing protein 1 [Sceloporus undulatus]XP_042325667.1 MANSC domain-containing protein 1 [Sceloporus undulatus]
MSLWIAQCFACALAVVVCVMLKPSQSQACSTEKMENITVDIQKALSKGIRGTDPISTASSEACVNMCCLGAEIEGNKLCNYVVFNAKKKGNSPNCYLFYFPTTEICPVKQVLGLVTYRIIKEISKPAPITSVVFHPTVNGSFMSAQIAMFDPYNITNASHEPDPLQKPIASNQMEILDHSDRIDEHSQYPKEERGNDSERTPPHKSSSVLLPGIVNPIQHTVPTAEHPVKLPVVTTGSQTVTVATLSSRVSPSRTTNTKSATVYHGNTPLEAANPRSTSISHPSAASESSASKTNQLPSSLPTKDSSASLYYVLLHNEQQEFEGDKLGGNLDQKQTALSVDQSVLLIALLFGVIFLLLVTVLVGRKMLESLQQRQYTRLDYLINGMYANV